MHKLAWFIAITLKYCTPLYLSLKFCNGFNRQKQKKNDKIEFWKSVPSYVLVWQYQRPKKISFFPAIIVVTSNVTQKCQRHISRLFVSGVLCFKYALGDMCCMRILVYSWNFEKKIRKCIINRADWTSSSVLHCNVTVAAWRRENTRDVGAAF